MDKPEELVWDYFQQHPAKHLGKGQVLLRPGDTITKVPYIESGSIIQYDISSAGNTVIVNAYKPGAFFPMSAVMNHLPTDYFFEAASPTVVRLAPAAHVIAFLHDNPAVTYDLLRRVYRGVDGVLSRTVQLMGGSATSRLVYELINAGYRFGQLNPDGSRFLPMSENDIAKRTGLSRETVNRVGRELKKQKLIRVSVHGIDIPDLAALESLFETLR